MKYVIEQAEPEVAQGNTGALVQVLCDEVEVCAGWAGPVGSVELAGLLEFVELVGFVGFAESLVAELAGFFFSHAWYRGCFVQGRGRWG